MKGIASQKTKNYLTLAISFSCVDWLHRLALLFDWKPHAPVEIGSLEHHKEELAIDQLNTEHSRPSLACYPDLT